MCCISGVYLINLDVRHRDEYYRAVHELVALRSGRLGQRRTYVCRHSHNTKSH
jgi:hypothetical protein